MLISTLFVLIKIKLCINISNLPCSEWMIASEGKEASAKIMVRRAADHEILLGHHGLQAVEHDQVKVAVDAAKFVHQQHPEHVASVLHSVLAILGIFLARLSSPAANIAAVALTVAKRTLGQRRITAAMGAFASSIRFCAGSTKTTTTVIEGLLTQEDSTAHA